MNKYLTRIKQALVAAALTVTAALAITGGGSVNAIPYTGENTQPSPIPAFNVYTGVTGIDNPDESKFFNGRLSTETNADARDPIATACMAGTKFVLRAYVHNGASQANNGTGNGPSVAKDTKIKVTLPTADAANFAPTAMISSSNAASISDNVTISCTNGKTFTLRYVSGSAQQFNSGSGVQNLSDSIVTTGAPIGTQSPNGDMWGCWDQRVFVRLEVELVEKPVVINKPATCDLLDATKGTKSITINKVNFTANDATINSVTVAFGDSTTKVLKLSELPYTHNYAATGNYSIKATLNTSLGDVTSAACTASITKTVTPPVTPPTTIPDTGAGSVIAIFAMVTAAGAFVHNMLARRNARG